ncbi:MAG: extracellular solute-binding protein [Acutalibacter muris]|nr:extracellular solute-binding protein [Acutalibacter muris]
MKKMISIILSFLLMLSIFAGCQSDTNNIAVVNDDIPTIYLLVDFMMDQIGDSIFDYVQRIPGYNTEFKVDFTYLPAGGVERETQMTAIRTAILAGKGPDIFICCCPSSGYDDVKPLFGFPKQIMDQHIFLQLDTYLQNTQYMEWDKLFQPVMEAGKNKEGQQVLPISYVIAAMLFDSDIYSVPQSPPKVWDDFVRSDDAMIQYAASHVRVSNVFGELADYGSDQMAFSEMELFDRYSEILSLREKAKEEDIFQKFQDSGGAIQMDIGAPDIPMIGEKLDDSSPKYMIIPQYNLSGGITANVTAFAAINRNTKYPDISFRFLDFLLSKDIQGKSQLYGNIKGMPVHTELGQKSYPAMTVFGGSWYMSDWNFQEYTNLLEQVNAVKFYTELDDSITQINILLEEGKKSLETIVHNQYVKMQMLLAES